MNVETILASKMFDPFSTLDRSLEMHSLVQLPCHRSKHGLFDNFHLGGRLIRSILCQCCIVKGRELVFCVHFAKYNVRHVDFPVLAQVHLTWKLHLETGRRVFGILSVSYKTFLNYFG